MDAIRKTIETALRLRDRARDGLAERIYDVYDVVDAAYPGPHVKIDAGGHRLHYGHYDAEVSQGSGWSVYSRRRNVLHVDDYVLRERDTDAGYWDGHNWQHHLGRRPRCAPVRVLVALARALPAVVAERLAAREVELAEQTRAAEEARDAL
jgi:hypothetical protein